MSRGELVRVLIEETLNRATLNKKDKDKERKMEVITGDRYLESLLKFVENHAGPLIEGSLVLKLNPVGLHYVCSRIEALNELEMMIAGAPVDYLRAYISDLGDHRAIEQLRRILCRLTSLKVVSVLTPPSRDPTPLSLVPFRSLKVLELRRCDLSTSAAKGLLELRHTLEKLVCHNSTDALRHVFASRITGIKGSPQWKRLSFVSCACNHLILMDESLQLLPAVATLDLSRNKFSKVDNLRRCSNLTHLDLGFNQLRSVASLKEISSHIRKLVLRNNALTSLQGIESLKSLEALDLSNNMISSFRELEVLLALPSLKNLWLEGNPICCARWYRPQVFSFFISPEKLKLDDKEINALEFWKWKFIITRRQIRPASYGFYSPAIEDTEEEAITHMKTRKYCRLASIQNEDHMSSIQDSFSFDTEIHSGENRTATADEADIADMSNRREFMKKDHSILWLRGHDEWRNQQSEDFGYETRYASRVVNGLQNMPGIKDIGESSKHVSDSLQASEGYSNSKIMQSFPGLSAVSNACNQLDATTVMTSKEFCGANYGETKLQPNTDPNQDSAKFYSQAKRYPSASENDSGADFGDKPGGSKFKDTVGSSLTSVNDVPETWPSSLFPGSPPHYQQDILFRLQNLEDFVQLSDGSSSLLSSDSDTSSSEDERCGNLLQSSHCKHIRNQEFWDSIIDGNPLFLSTEKDKHGISHFPKVMQNGICSADLHAELPCSVHTPFRKEGYLAMLYDKSVASGNGEYVSKSTEEVDISKSLNFIRKVQRRVPLPLSVDNNKKNRMDFDTEPLYVSDKNSGFHGDSFVDEEKKNTDWNKVTRNQHAESCTTMFLVSDDTSRSKMEDQTTLKMDYIEGYFNSVVGDSKVHETSVEYIVCSCIAEQETQCEEREVVVLVSSERKLYLLLANSIIEGAVGSVIMSHKVKDVSKVLVGLALQVLRVYIADGASYVCITKSADKTKQLLNMLEVFSLKENNRNCCIRSLDRAQMDLFDKNICKSLQVNIYQYSMVLFRRSHSEGGWTSRSLFVDEGHLFLCIEDVKKFSSLSENTPSSPYFLLDSVCCIADVCEMVIKGGENCCVISTQGTGQRESCLSGITHLFMLNIGAGKREVGPSRAQTWWLKWLSRETLLQFVALFKAIHAGMTMSTLSIKHIQ